MITRAQLLLLTVIALLFVASTAYQQSEKVVRHPDSNTQLIDRWKWARVEAESRKFSNGYWIGYSIQRLMQRNWSIGTHFSDERRNHPSLAEVITGQKEVDIRSLKASGQNLTIVGNQIIIEDETGRHEKVMKEIGILFHFPRDRADQTNQVIVSNLSLIVDLEGAPLLWLGGADEEESVAFLHDQFTSSRSDEVKEQLIAAIGLHEKSKKVFTTLREALTGSETNEVREEAAFWLGQMNTDEALKLLVHTVETDRSDDIREKAIFAISQMEGELALDALIGIARKNPDSEVRTKAMFWLGQKASEKAVATLRDIAYSEEETDVQKSALFALTQLPDHTGTDELIKIAKTHPNPKVRKEAIFWLGQCDDDPRALETLIEIVKN
ncbi:MAG: HEAT repeat domain-containing protein [Ignavibacteria bacterium]|nr:HEAT repeat domain-containing protein [Ignavibacteria bacterium]